MNKHLKNLVIILAILAIMVTPIFIYIEVNKNELIFVYMLYDNIQYNGHDYYMLKDQTYCPYHEGGEVRGPVYVVKASKVYKKNSYTAYVYTGYDGEEEEIYLCFDERYYIRDDYITKETVENLFYPWMWSN